MGLFKWQASISCAEWDSEIVIYHHEAGETYLFGEAAKIVLAVCLLHEQFSSTDLIETTRDCFEDMRQAESFIASILQSLMQKDLITAVAV